MIKDKAVVCLGAASSSGSNFRRDVYTFDGTTWDDKEPLVDQDGRGFDNDYNQIPAHMPLLLCLQEMEVY